MSGLEQNVWARFFVVLHEHPVADGWRAKESFSMSLFLKLLNRFKYSLHFHWSILAHAGFLDARKKKILFPYEGEIGLAAETLTSFPINFFYVCK